MPPEPRPHRPDMAAGYGIHAGEDGLLPWSEVSERMEQPRSYWVCTVRPDGRRHAMPVWAVWVDKYALRAGKVFAWHERDYPRSATRWRLV